jgi:hypothetical protein
MPTDSKSTAENMNVCERKGSLKKLNVRGKDSKLNKLVELISFFFPFLFPFLCVERYYIDYLILEIFCN